MKYRAILLLGAPGSGKGTQGRILGAIPSFFHCACGDVFRAVKPGSRLGRKFMEYSSRGQLVPDGPTVQLWRGFIEKSARAGRFKPDQDTLVLDGIPRNVVQAQMLEDALDVRGILYLHSANIEPLVERLRRRALKENRLDDADIRVIRERFKTYDAETKPLLSHYGRQLVKRINSNRTPIKVLRDILGCLDRMR